ncbi:MAG: hypothetical protein ACFB3T_02220 [Geminicoccaceae bacterium]
MASSMTWGDLVGGFALAGAIVGLSYCALAAAPAQQAPQLCVDPASYAQCACVGDDPWLHAMAARSSHAQALAGTS